MSIYLFTNRLRSSIKKRIGRNIGHRELPILLIDKVLKKSEVSPRKLRCKNQRLKEYQSLKIMIESKRIKEIKTLKMT